MNLIPYLMANPTMTMSMKESHMVKNNYIKSNGYQIVCESNYFVNMNCSLSSSTNSNKILIMK